MATGASLSPHLSIKRFLDGNMVKILEIWSSIIDTKLKWVLNNNFSFKIASNTVIKEKI